jgi:FtsH-binding integral membrane protein
MGNNHINLVIVIACTLYAFLTPTDFTAQSGIMVVLSVTLLVLALITMFTDSPLMNNIYCGFGVLVFGIYLIIDTQMIMGGKTL